MLKCKNIRLWFGRFISHFYRAFAIRHWLRKRERERTERRQKRVAPLPDFGFVFAGDTADVTLIRLHVPV